jgi:hypothetical protein
LTGHAAAQTSEPEPLASGSIEELSHPLARDANPLGRVQALLAVVPRPDLTALRDYVEQLSAEGGRAAHRALGRASRALGFGQVQAYVSRGSKSVGLCAYEGDPALVLIGSRHLTAGDEYAMSEQELAFALASEVAHLRFGHARVTSSEVWAGALSRSRQGFDLVLGILPMLKGWRVADGLQRWSQRLPPDLLRRVVTRAGGIAAEKRLHEAAQRSDVLSRLNEQLVAAHRVMQLSADRAGLLLAGDPGVALRAMLLVRPDYRLADAGRPARSACRAGRPRRRAEPRARGPRIACACATRILPVARVRAPGAGALGRSQHARVDRRTDRAHRSKLLTEPICCMLG